MGGVLRHRQLAKGDVVNHRYAVLRLLGEGGMGRVYLVADRLEADRAIALKTLRGEHGDPSSYEFFAHEFEALTKLKHPNLAEVHDFGRIDTTGELFFTLEYVVGQNLFLATEGAGTEVILDSFVQLCRALGYIHSRGLIHHDVKPENVLVADGTSARAGRVKLMDFGLALEEELARNLGEIRGTLSYVAPEVAAGDPYDRRCDFYSLGIVLYRLLRRRLPIEESVQPETPFFSLIPRPPDPDRIDSDARFQPLVRRLANPDPAERFADAGAIVAEVNRLFGTSYEVETKETATGYFLSGSLVGRTRERERLDRIIGELQLGAPATPVLVVGGEAGIGKSRLLREWKVKCQLAGIEFVVARCYENLIAPYGAAAAIVRQLVALVGPSSRAVDSRRAALSRVVPELAQKGDAFVDDDVPAGPRERLRLVNTLAEFVIDVCANRPTVLAIGDLQWADSETVEWLKHLARTLVLAHAGASGDSATPDLRPRRPSLFVCGSCRDDELAGTPIEAALADLGGSPFVERMFLAPLEPDEVGELLRSMIGRDDLPPALVARVAEETDGNPYFIEEVMKSLVEDDQLGKSPDAWNVRVDTRRLRIPSSCEQVVQRRLGRLDPASRRVLEVLAVLEGPSPLALIEAVAGDAGLLARRGLRALQRQQLLRRERDPAGYRYFIHHNATRRVAYGAIEPARLAALHRAAASSIEALYAGERDAHVRPLARHHRLGGNRPQAIEYALAAARDSSRLHAHAQAIEHLREALELLDPADPADTSRRYAALLDLADLHKNVGAYDTSRDYYDQARALAPDDRSRAELLRRLAEMTARRGQYTEALAIYDEVERLLPGLTDSGELRARLFVGQGRVLELTGAYDQGVAKGRAALALDPPEDIQVTAGQLLGNLSWCLGRYSEAIEHHGRALAIEERRGNSYGLAACYNNLALVHQDQGRTDEALALYSKSLVHWRRYGEPAGGAMCLSNMGVLHKERGEYEKSLDHHQRALTEYRRLGDQIGVARIEECLGEVYADLGRWSASEDSHRRCLEICEATGHVPLSIYAHINLGQNHATFGDLESADAHAATALERATRLNARMLVGAAHLLAGDVARRRGDWAVATEALERACAIFAELGQRQEWLRASLARALTDADQGAHARALERASGALDEARRLAHRELVAVALHLCGCARHATGSLAAARRDLDDATSLAGEIDRKELLWRICHDSGRLYMATGELEAARRVLLRAVALGRGIWEELPADLKARFLVDPRHLRLAADVAELKARGLRPTRGLPS